MAGGFKSPNPLLRRSGGAVAAAPSSGGYPSPIALLRHRGGAVPAVSSAGGYRSRYGFWFGGLCARASVAPGVTVPNNRTYQEGGNGKRRRQAQAEIEAEQNRMMVVHAIIAIVTSGVLDE